MKSNATILVVDDEPLLREIMAEWLGQEGYKVETAQDGIDALEVLEAKHVDGIVTDIRMPRMDGVTLLKKLKESPSYTPSVVFVSGFADIDRREAYALGAETLIAKPFTDETLLRAVARMLTPREELWRSAQTPPPGRLLESEFCTVALAREEGRLAFGRGGFCLRSAAERTEGPVRFELRFQGEGFRMAGDGEIRWVRSGETELGVEIDSLKEDCLQRGIELTVRGGARSYIPGTARG